ncbi:hypothetical protein [Streptococcus pluranimalium]|uniref:Uncharacterized protein n=1 Tax=Streptococcus pluranimalium TaxID=82348 RepID=A0A345VIH8_9STRE|nr:hypothetical protein [Streptococcus pluranimalium]AXJ12490.1 hypothetical protein Sp14A_05600 [Streptococcus pluranimalium]AXJ12530.1 hypothetical protein Sp14A_06000 [Streptococcus pluranimalium]
MKRTRKPFNLNPLIHAILIICSVLSVIVALFTAHENKTLREQNRALSERVEKLPEAFGGVGYISEVGDGYIDVVGYGRFLINEDEAQFLDEGDKAPRYILERGQ